MNFSNDERKTSFWIRVSLVERVNEWHFQILLKHWAKSCLQTRNFPGLYFCARLHRDSVIGHWHSIHFASLDYLWSLSLKIFKQTLSYEKYKFKHLPGILFLLLIPFFLSSLLSFARFLDLFLRKLWAGDTLYFPRAVFLCLFDMKGCSP